MTNENGAGIKQETEQIKRTVTTDILLSIGQIGGLICAVWWISEKLHGIDTRLLNIESRIERRWTVDDQKIWSQQLQIDNPSLSVPKINNQQPKP